MNSNPRVRHDVRGRGSDDVVGRGREDATREAPEDTARIKSEIARTREDMSETIDAIQDKLSPRNLVSQAKESVKEATVGRVKQAARSVGHSASEIAEQTRDVAADVAGSVRSNPWPALLIGAGTAWMLFDRARNSSRDRSSYDRSFDYGDRELDLDNDKDKDSGATSYYQKVRTRGAYGYETGDAAGSTRAGLKQASSQVQDLLERNPLVVGAVAAAVGVAIGLALPETERENQLMGDTRDTLVERAQGAAQGAVKRAKQVAGEAATQVASEAARAVSGETANKS